jgi:hypothetical protein
MANAVREREEITMNRRGFLGAMLTACAAPAIVRADSLMRIVPVSTIIARPADILTLSRATTMLTLWGDGIHDDTEALQAAINGLPVNAINPRSLLQSKRGTMIIGGQYALSKTIHIPDSPDYSISLIGNHFQFKKGVDAGFFYDSPTTKLITDFERV